MNSFKGILTAHRWLFLKLLLVWFVLNIVQAIFTEIGNDEAYYWVYSRFLDWGYYDHPPMIALIIRLGSLLFDGELGARFFTALIQLPFLIIIFKLIDVEPTKKAILVFFTIAFSVVMIQAYGFVAAPDGPMLLFSALFLLGYKYFLEKESFGNAALMGISMALLIYSKYHGVLFIGFVVLSNLKLLLNYKFYLAGILALVLLIPHMLWQYENNFPSITYHLVQRSSYFKLNEFFEFLANQLVVFHPLTLGALVYVIFKRKIANLFERALVFIVLGFFIFFTLSNFKGYVNPHWTVALSVALVILVVREALVNEKLQRFVFKWIAPSLVLLLIARVILIFDILPLKTEWHGHKQRMKDIGVIANNTPVIFFNRFQEPSKYMFYTGKKVHSHGQIYYFRNTQFDLWRFDENFRGDTVMLVVGSSSQDAIKKTIENRHYYVLKVPNYRPYKLLKVDVDTIVTNLPRETKISIPVKVTNLYGQDFDFNHPSMPIGFSIVISNKYKVFHTINATYSIDSTLIKPSEFVHGAVSFTIPNEFVGEYKLWVCHNALNFGNVTISPFINVNIQ